MILFSLLVFFYVYLLIFFLPGICGKCRYLMRNPGGDDKMMVLHCCHCHHVGDSLLTGTVNTSMTSNSCQQILISVQGFSHPNTEQTKKFNLPCEEELHV
jgi:hypothetical protein